MDRQNTNEKKTLKKGRRGWVISAAIVALLGILAGTVVLQNQSSQNQGKSESVTVSDSSSKEKEYSTTDTIKETEKSFPPKVDAKEELSKVFVATKEVGVEDSIKSLDKSYEKLSEITKVEEKLKSQVTNEGEEAVKQVSRQEVGNKDNKILEKSDSLTKKVEVEKTTLEKGKLVVRPELPSLVVTDDKGISAVQQELPELVVSDKGTPEVQPKLPELVISEKGTPEVQPKLPELVISDKGTPEVQPKLPELVVSEKGTPEVQTKLPELVVSEKGFGKRTKVSNFPSHKRGGVGIKAAVVTAKTGPIISVQTIDPEITEALLVSQNGQTIRLGLSDIKLLGRTTQGVTIMRLSDGDAVSSIGLMADRPQDEGN